MRTRWPILTLAYAAACLACCSIVACLVPWVYPNFRHAEIRWEDGIVQEVTWPFIGAEAKGEGAFTVAFPLDLGRLYPTRFLVVADDRLDFLIVNGTLVATEQFPIFHDNQSGVALNLENYLRSGRNELRFFMHNDGGKFGLRMFVHPLDKLHIAFTVLLSGAVCALVMPLIRMLGGGGLAATLIVLGGVVVRVAYFVATPYYFRGYDQGGHLQYIKYFAENLTLPSVNLGWQTHQPPLYYVVTGGWLRIFGGGHDCSWSYGQLQMFGLALSIASLLVTIGIAKTIFENNLVSRNHMLALVSCFPGSVYYSARINNDVLFGFLAFLWLWALLCWCKSQSWRMWIAMCVLLASSCLVKNTAYVLVAATVVVCLITTTRISQVVKSTAVLALVVVAISGWFQIGNFREARDLDSTVVGNLAATDQSLRIRGWTRDLVTVDVTELVGIPFNHSRDDKFRRAYFPEFYLKSALFGEWAWGDHLLLPARVLMAVVIVMLAVAVFGMLGVKELTCSRPLIAVAALILLAQMVLVYRAPFSCCQDFRFFVVQCIPFCAFVAHGAAKVGVLGEYVVYAGTASAVAFLSCLIYS